MHQVGFYYKKSLIMFACSIVGLLYEIGMCERIAKVSKKMATSKIEDR